MFRGNHCFVTRQSLKRMYIISFPLKMNTGIIFIVVFTVSSFKENIQIMISNYHTLSYGCQYFSQLPVSYISKGNPGMHDDVIKWKQFLRYWLFVRGIHRSPVNSPHKGQWRGALMFSLICAWTNGWVNNRHASDLKRHCNHYDVTAVTIKMFCVHLWPS